MVEGIPFPSQIAYRKQGSEAYVVCYHASPDGKQSEMEDVDGEKGQKDPDAPHTEKRIIKRLYGISHSVEDSFQNDEDAKKRF